MTVTVTKQMVELYTLGVLPPEGRRLIEAAFDVSPQVQEWFLDLGELPEHAQAELFRMEWGEQLEEHRLQSAHAADRELLEFAAAHASSTDDALSPQIPVTAEDAVLPRPWDFHPFHNSYVQFAVVILLLITFVQATLVFDWPEQTKITSPPPPPMAMGRPSLSDDGPETAGGTSTIEQGRSYHLPFSPRAPHWQVLLCESDGTIRLLKRGRGEGDVRVALQNVTHGTGIYYVISVTSHAPLPDLSRCLSGKLKLHILQILQNREFVRKDRLLSQRIFSQLIAECEGVVGSVSVDSTALVCVPSE